MMTLIADGLLLAAALTAAFYCRILAIRLRRLGRTDQGLGGAISALNFQVDAMKETLQAVSVSAKARTAALERHTIRAEAASRRLELLLAGLHDAEDSKPTRPDVERLLKLSPKDRVQGKAQPDAIRGVSRNVSRRKPMPMPEDIR
jgi:hypothetical protein